MSQLPTYLLHLVQKCGQDFGAGSYWQETQQLLCLRFPQVNKKIFEYFYVQQRFIMLLDLWIIDGSSDVLTYSSSSSGSSFSMNTFAASPGRLRVNYLLENLQDRARVRLEFFWDETNPFLSVTHLWKNAHWYEREAWDLYGVKFSGPSLPRLLLPENFSGHPLRKDYIPREFLEESIPTPAEQPSAYLIRPSHPYWQEGPQIRSGFSGEYLHTAQAEIGFTHRGIEKMLEQVTFAESIQLLQSLNHHALSSYSTLWCMAIESYLNWQIPPRAQAIRMISLEWARLVDHLYALEYGFYEVGAKYHYLQVCKLRQQLQAWSTSAAQTVTNAHLLPRLGGMQRDLSIPQILSAKKLLPELLQQIKKWQQQLQHHPGVNYRQQGRALSVDSVLNWGLTGPILRAAGINYDLRKIHPFYFYSAIDFTVALGNAGTCEDIYQVRLQEIEQSISIILQLLNYLPEGSIHELPSEKLRWGEFTGVQPSPGEQTLFIESPQGALGVSLCFNGSGCAYRARLRTPGMAHLQSLQELLVGLNFADAKLMIASFNVAATECDR